MSTRSAQYENLTAELCEKLRIQCSSLSNGKLEIGSKNRRLGMSGCRHQIDVSVESDTHLLLIECKQYARRVDLPTALSFAARLIDIRQKKNHKKVVGSIVTTNGYQSGVALIARHFEFNLDVVSSLSQYVMSLPTSTFIGMSDGLGLRDKLTVREYRRNSYNEQN